MKTAQLIVNIYIDEDNFDEEAMIERVKEDFFNQTGYEALGVSVEIQE